MRILAPAPIREQIQNVSNDIDTRRRRAAYRVAHRGTKEMDLVLGKFAQLRLPEMAEAELGLFEELLLQPDPELQDYIWGAKIAPPQFAPLVMQIRAFHRLDTQA